MPFFPTSSLVSKAPVGLIPRCGTCGLRKKCHSPGMKTTGKGHIKVLFIGEAPGEEEDRTGEQLVGKAGQVLRKILRMQGVNLDDCWKENAVACRPPKNEIEDIYIESCRPRLFEVIRRLNPEVIVLLGISAVKSVIGTEWTADIGPLTRWVGWTIPSQGLKAWVCPTYHPSYVGRLNEDPALVKVVSDHLKKAMSLEGEPLCSEPLSAWRSKVNVVLLGSDARMRMLEIVRHRGPLVVDYETTGLKPDLEGHRIVSVSFCVDPQESFACMLDESLMPVLSKVLRSPTSGKVASNLKFEERWTRARLGHSVENWYWDTMLNAHILDNRRGVTGLKFQTYVLLGVPDYDRTVAPYLEARYSNGFNRIHLLNPQDLLLYGGLDAIFEYQVMLRQQEVLL